MSVDGVEWSPDTVCVFDGLQSVVERCTVWYEDRLSAEKASELLRADEKEERKVVETIETRGPVVQWRKIRSRSESRCTSLSR